MIINLLYLIYEIAFLLCVIRLLYHFKSCIAFVVLNKIHRRGVIVEKLRFLKKVFYIVLLPDLPGPVAD